MGRNSFYILSFGFTFSTLNFKFSSCLSSAPLHLSRILDKSPLFMQNKPNFQNAQMNVTSLITVDYENKSNWKLGKNKPNTNPIKPNFRKAKMFLNFYLTRDYENKSNWKLGENKPNSKPIKAKTNPIQTQYEPKTNPIKPNFYQKSGKTCAFGAKTCADSFVKTNVFNSFFSAKGM